MFLVKGFPTPNLLSNIKGLEIIFVDLCLISSFSKQKTCISLRSGNPETKFLIPILKLDLSFASGCQNWVWVANFHRDGQVCAKFGDVDHVFCLQDVQQH